MSEGSSDAKPIALSLHRSQVSIHEDGNAFSTFREEFPLLSPPRSSSAEPAFLQRVDTPAPFLDGEGNRIG